MARRLRPVALLAGGALALPVLLAGCGSDEEEPPARAVAPDIAPAARGELAEGGTLRWAVDATPRTLNAFQADADAGTGRVAGAALPALFTLDPNGRPQRNPDYLVSAEVVAREPKQVVRYELDRRAVWSNGRDLGAADFEAQWRALSGEDSAYWTARNAGYDRIAKVERGADGNEVRVTFDEPYADWRSLFTPLYPKEVMGSADAFNDRARSRLKVTAGPFAVKKVDRDGDKVTLVRNPRWWGEPAKLESIVLKTVPRGKRAAALAGGKVDLADVGREEAARIPAAGAKSSRALDVRKSLESAYTQLTLNGSSGPLSDERVRRAVARALDRPALAEAVLGPLGLPAKALGSHVALVGQQAYSDNSDALGTAGPQEARALLAEAGWKSPGAAKEPGAAAGGEADSGPGAGERRVLDPARDAAALGAVLARQAEALEDGGKGAGGGNGKGGGSGKKGEDSKRDKTAGKKSGEGKTGPKNSGEKKSGEKPGEKKSGGKSAEEKSGGAKSGRPALAGAYAPRGTPAPGSVPLSVSKDGKPLTLRLVLPAGPGTETLHTVGERIGRMLRQAGIRTETDKVSGAGYFKDHIAAGEFDLALYSWPGSAYPATDARPIHAKPRPAADGSLVVEQNYARVGTDHIDQLFARAAGELDEGASRALLGQADARLWAAAGSIPLYQRPELVAARPELANAGAFGLSSPRYQDIGYRK